MCGRLGVLGAAAVFAAALPGQTGVPPRFEVVSVKPGGDVFSTRPERSGGRFRWMTQLCYLVGYAEDLDFSRVSGPPCGGVYVVEATFDPSATNEQVRAMLRTTLAERFHLRGRRVTTQVDGHALVAAKGGVKLKTAEAVAETPERPAPGAVWSNLLTPGVVRVTGSRATVSQLAQELGRAMRSPFWDRTGLAGRYDFEFLYKQDAVADAQSDAPSLGTALDRLGLKLEKQKGPLDTYVIESFEKPAEN